MCIQSLCLSTGYVVVCYSFSRGLEQFIKRYPGAVGSDKDADGNTALHIAVANNHLDTVCLLADDSVSEPAVNCRPIVKC